MHYSIVITLIIAATVFHCQKVTATDSTNKTSEFVATKEWQVVGEGQSIPQGLHVRINLQTGVKEAKLLDESERGTALQSQSTDEDESKTVKEPLSLEHKANIIEESVRKAKKHRDYAELRKAYKDYQKNFRTDGELIMLLMEQYRNFSKPVVDSEVKSKLNVLENLEYMLHQIDNALVFVDNGGLDEVLLPVIVNETIVELRISAMRVLSALTGNNPKAQIKVFERNFGSHLSQVLMKSTHNPEIFSALHAFGALLRKFPLAQQRILSTSGTQALISVLRNADVELRIKAKVVTLISDLVVEKQSVLDASRDSPEESASSLAQYVLIEFDSWLHANDYCSTLSSVLSKDYVNLLDQPEIVEQFIVVLESTASMCQQLWSQSAELRHALLTIRNRFSHSQDEYKLEISQGITKISQKFYEKHTHTEL